MEEDIVMVSIRGRTPGSSKNSLREALVSSTILSKPYHKCMKIQNLNPLWFDQVEYKYFPQSLSTNTEESNISNGSDTGNNLKSKQCKDNVVPALNDIRSPHIEHMVSSQNTLNMIYIEVLINYNINAPMEANA